MASTAQMNVMASWTEGRKERIKRIPYLDIPQPAAQKRSGPPSHQPSPESSLKSQTRPGAQHQPIQHRHQPTLEYRVDRIKKKDSRST